MKLTESQKHQLYDINDSNHWQWHTTFVGSLMQHNYRLYSVLDNVFEKFTPHSIVEIGTARGALSTYLGLWGIKLGIPVMTLDIVDKHDHLPEKLGVKFILGDCFDSAVKKRILDFIGDKPVLFICDGGDKQREFSQYVPLLPSTSVIMSHDWKVEFHLEDIPKAVRPLVVPFIRERWNEMGNQSIFFQKF